MKKIIACLLGCITMAGFSTGVLAVSPNSTTEMNIPQRFDTEISPRFTTIIKTIQDVYVEDGQLKCWGYIQCREKATIKIRIKIQDKYNGKSTVKLDKTVSKYDSSFDVIQSIPYQKGHYYTITYEYTAPGDNPSTVRYYS